MKSRLLARNVAAIGLATALAPAWATVTYDGTEGVAAQIFSTCGGCHPSNGTGRSFASYSLATEYLTSGQSANGGTASVTGYSDARANARVATGAMPSGSPLEQALRDLLNDWASQRVGATAPLQNAAAQMTTVAASSVAHYSATLNANVIENGIDTTFTFRYSTSSATVSGGGGTAASAGSPSGTGGGNNTYALAAGISSLACGTTYYFRINGTTGTSGSTLNFTTSACPTINNVPNGTATEDQLFSYTATSANASGLTISYSLTNAPSGMAINASTGQITWTPANGVTTSGTVTVTASFNSGATVSADTFTVTVTPVNDAPSLAVIPAQSATEDTAWSYQGAVTDVDDSNNGTNLSWSLSNAPTGMAVSTTGLVTWTPLNGVTTSGTVTLTVQDGGEDSALPASRTFTVAVTPVNDAPSLAAIPAQSATEDTAWSYQGVPTDVDDSNNGTNLSWSLSNAPTGMAVSTTGLVTWTPLNGVLTSGTVTLTVQDGGEDSALPASRTFTVTVTAVNDAPVIGGISDGALTELSTLDIQVGVTDVDDANNGSNLTWSVLAGAPSWATISTTGLLHLAPPQNSDGVYPISIRVADGGEDGATASTTSFTLTINRLDTDLDTVADYNDNCPTVSNLSQLNTDGDSEGDACDSDDDNDNVADTAEAANGYSTTVAQDHAALDKDGDGISNLDEFNACVVASDPTCASIGQDSVAPTVTPTAPVALANIDGTGYFTPVRLEADATDLPDGNLTATIYEIDGVAVFSPTNPYPFRPGAHTVRWRALDKAGNEGLATQTFTVLPLVSSGGSQVVDANFTAYVPVRLNGDAASYPVTVDFSVQGGTAGADYNVASTSVVFPDANPQLIAVTLLPAAVGRDLVFKLTASTPEAVLAAGSASQHTLRVASTPLAPDATLRVAQSGQLRPVVYAADGTITVDALVTDPNGGGATCIAWSAPAFVLTAGGTPCDVLLDPSATAAGVRSISVTLSDGSFVVTRSIEVAVQTGSAPALSASDSDGDGVTNDLELAEDENGNGLLDYLDVTGTESPESIPLNLNAADLSMMAVADGGLHLVAGGYAIAAQSPSQAGIQIFESQVAKGARPNIDTEHAAIGAVFDFEVQGLTEIRRRAHVVLPLPIVLLPNVQLRELSSAGAWQDFVATNGDAVMSAPRGANGQCPPPGDAKYQNGLTPGDGCLQLVVTDGGRNDADGAVNGSVRVTVAPTVARDEVEAVIPTESQSEGGGSADLALLMLLALASLGFRRKEQL
jgi:hypothetical protein